MQQVTFDSILMLIWDGNYQIPGEHSCCMAGWDLGTQDFKLLQFRCGDDGLQLWVLVKPGKTRSTLLPLHQSLMLLDVKEELSDQHATGCSPWTL